MCAVIVYVYDLNLSLCCLNLYDSHVCRVEFDLLPSISRYLFADEGNCSRARLIVFVMVSRVNGIPPSGDPRRSIMKVYMRFLNR